MGKDMVTFTKNILLIDDEPDITFTIKNILGDNGFKVDSFTDPISALDNYQINYYDLIILDALLRNSSFLTHLANLF